jgi:choline kinase
VYNPNFTTGSIESLWAVRDALVSGNDVLLMDADVLYPFEILARLATSSQQRCLLLDRLYVPGDEPVKVCVRDGAIVDFSKQPDPGISWDFTGESIGFFRFDPAGAARLAALSEQYVGDGRRTFPHEAAIREMILAGGHGIGFEDVSGAPWIEIDFPEDIRRATDHILPRIDHA